MVPNQCRIIRQYSHNFSESSKPFSPLQFELGLSFSGTPGQALHAVVDACLEQDPDSKVSCDQHGDGLWVIVNIEQHSPDIAHGVHGRPEEIGAADQRPSLSACLSAIPDGKTQVTVEYCNVDGAVDPIRVHTLLISTQHDETVTSDEIARELKEHVIDNVIPEYYYLDDKTIFHLNPSCRFVIGGPHDGAVRKIITDTYGGWGAHGGAAFSGKDPTNVDRSGAYLARQAAKSIVAIELCTEVHGASISEIVRKNFDFRPGMIPIDLDLKRGNNGRFCQTAAYGHFGREEPGFTWEVVKPLRLRH
ncbi:hypothetical protein SASPL_128295 [Salvia splendens]|uniref:methionine adenosyltransferase n=1 Tax=Salvia splendens TaxID=180675 RepID=A0A8X8XC85_SALSN|nr:hypothetical protein SASPL_128295 [Salvia splendens]